MYKKYFTAVVRKILSEPELLKPLQTSLEELKAGFGASGIELLNYKVVSMNGKKEQPNKDLSKQDPGYFELETPLDIVLEVLPKKRVNTDHNSNQTSSENNTNQNNTNNNSNSNTNSSSLSTEQEELPFITHFILSAPIKHLSDKVSASKDILCFLSNGNIYRGECERCWY